MATRRRPQANPDRLIILELHVAAERFGRAVELDENPHGNAVAALKAGSRTGRISPAEEAVLCIAYGNRAAADLLKAASADREAIAIRVEEGERRRNKRKPSAP